VEEVMKARVIDAFDEVKDIQSSAVALGFFDGFHLGHQAILDETLKQAQQWGVSPILLTFDRHPWEILFPERQRESLMSRVDKVAYLKEYGIEELLFLKVTSEFLQVSGKDFFYWLIKSLKPKSLISGPNYTFGSKQSGNSELLAEWGAKENIQVIVKDAIEFDDAIVSSTRIRSLLKMGEVGEVERLLGRFYHLNGTVVTGDGRGRTLGFPTANVAIEEELLLPGNGVYSVQARINEIWHTGVASVGTNPTFPGVRSRRLEVHILNFDSVIYEEEIRVAFCHYLRPELTFNGKEELIIQMEKDVIGTEEFFADKINEKRLPNWK